LQDVAQAFAAKKARALASANNASNLFSAAPQTITSPVLFTLFNTRPFDVPVWVYFSFVSADMKFNPGTVSPLLILLG
jgi:hypothetical protein